MLLPPIAGFSKPARRQRHVSHQFRRKAKASLTGQQLVVRVLRLQILASVRSLSIGRRFNNPLVHLL